MIYRPSQIENSGPVAIADRLTEKLREAGDLDIADPTLSPHPGFPYVILPDGMVAERADNALQTPSGRGWRRTHLHRRKADPIHPKSPSLCA